MGNPDKLLGTLQVDVDDLWVYYESIGRSTPAATSALAFTEGVPRWLDLFDQFSVRATFFVCGRDLPAQSTLLQEIVRRGHEVANHSAVHRNGYARLSNQELRADIAEAGDRIAQAVGQSPVGFKAPGFSFNPALPQILAELGYLYDSSLLPSFYAPVLRRLQGVLSRGRVDPTHYGRAVFGLAPLRPFRISGLGIMGLVRMGGKTSAHSIWEVPVTTVPLLRVPFHSTFVLSTGRWLFDLGLALALFQRVPINYLFHGADPADTVSDPALASYRFLTQPWARKRKLFEHMLAQLSRYYRLVPTRELVAAWTVKTPADGNRKEGSDVR